MLELSPAQVRRRERRAEARNAILEAAEALLLAEGIDGFSMRKLGLRCGCAAPTLYHYFGDKNGVIDAIVEETVQRLLKSMREVIRADDDPLENIRGLCSAFARFGIENPTHYELLMSRRSPEREASPSGEEAHTLLETQLQRLQHEGRLIVNNSKDVGSSLFMLLHGFFLLRQGPDGKQWNESLAEFAIEAMLQGFVGLPEKTPSHRSSSGAHQ